jgi:hypothetical protein
VRVIWNTTVSKGSAGYLEQAVYLSVVGEVWVIWNAKVSRGSTGNLEHHNKYEESAGF